MLRRPTHPGLATAEGWPPRHPAGDYSCSLLSDHFSLLVYPCCISRTNIDIDDHGCTEVMRRYRLATKRAARSSWS